LWPLAATLFGQCVDYNLLEVSNIVNMCFGYMHFLVPLHIKFCKSPVDDLQVFFTFS
jgi:hypothetical protein